MALIVLGTVVHHLLNPPAARLVADLFGVLLLEITVPVVPLERVAALVQCEVEVVVNLLEGVRLHAVRARGRALRPHPRDVLEHVALVPAALLLARLKEELKRAEPIGRRLVARTSDIGLAV